MNATHLTLKWGTSRGRETEGYAICTLTDDTAGTRYRCMGGGYDMTGTAFGEWLEANFPQELAAISHRAYTHATRPDHAQFYVRTENPNDNRLYGMTAYYNGPRRAETLTRVALDGACGIDCMVRIAKAIGLEVTREYKHAGRNRGETTGWLVTR